MSTLCCQGPKAPAVRGGGAVETRRRGLGPAYLGAVPYLKERYALAAALYSDVSRLPSLRLPSIVRREVTSSAPAASSSVGRIIRSLPNVLWPAGPVENLTS